MVYCGKPSKACGQCRLRRTRCDTLKPSCTQCIRAGRICGGYRDTETLIFRHCSKSFAKTDTNENSPTAPKRRELVETSSPSSNPGSPVWSDQLDNVCMSVLRYTSLEEEFATCFFFKNYVPNDHAFSRGTFHYLADVYRRETVSTSLKDAVVSIGTAGLAHFYRDPSIMVSANRKYSSALNSVSILLRDSASAKENQTLMAVILLGVYETHTCSSVKALESLNKHVSGAESLLQLRGKQQVETALGRELFSQTKAQVITRCWQTHTAVPDNIIQWSDAAIQYENVEEAAATRLSQIRSQLCNLRMLSTQISNSSTLYDHFDARNFIACALEINIELADWEATCFSAYHYRTVTSEEKSKHMYSDSYHVYSSLSAANIWNEYRLTRILVNELLIQYSQQEIQEELGSLEPETPSSFLCQLVKDSASTIVELAGDICSSVPFCLGSCPENGQGSKEELHPKAIAGNLLVWPLYIAARTEGGPEMREWAISRLRGIAENMGIRQAMVIAECVANNGARLL